MRRKLLVLVLVLGMAPLSDALMVRLSLDGIDPAPETVDVIPEELLTMYVISDSSGVSYWEWIHTANNNPAIITNVHSYPAAGDLASIIDLSTTLSSKFELTANDSVGNIQAGQHFSFDLQIAADATPGTTRYIYLDNAPLPDDSVLLNVVPEPATVLLLALGSLALLRKRRT